MQIPLRIPGEILIAMSIHKAICRGKYLMDLLNLAVGNFSKQAVEATNRMIKTV